jgi:trigger factor
MKTSVTELAASRVRVDVDVDASDLEGRMERAAGSLGKEMKVPGFRKGKVPAGVVLQRIGREAVLEQTLRDALPEWYERALLDARVNPVGEPALNVSALPGEGEPLNFSIEVAVRPKATLGNYTGLEVGRAEPDASDEAIQAELDRLRDRFARLEPVERQAADGDFVLIDYTGEIDGKPFEGGEARDHMIELGSGSLLDEFEQGLAGAAAGEEREVKLRFPDDYGAELVAGKDAVFAVTVKEVREKELPELDDDFAAEASEFDTLEELRTDIVGKIRHAVEHRIEDEFREAAVDAAAAEAKVDLPDDVVAARAAESWARIERSLTQRGIPPEQYLQMQGKTRDQMIEETKPEAAQALKREAVLEAIVDAEAIEVSEEELVEALGPVAEREETSAEKLLEGLRASGREALLTEDLRMRKAVDLLAAAAKPIPIEQAKAREAIWTPEKEKEEEGEGAGLWTPGD